MVHAYVSTADTDDVICEIVENVAEVKDVDSLELTPPLYEVIDPDALERILTTTPTDGQMDVQVTFTYNGCEVTVDGDGRVSVDE